MSRISRLELQIEDDSGNTHTITAIIHPSERQETNRWGAPVTQGCSEHVCDVVDVPEGMGYERCIELANQGI